MYKRPPERVESAGYLAISTSFVKQRGKGVIVFRVPSFLLQYVQEINVIASV